MEEQTPTTPEASTIDTASTTDNINNGETKKEGNNIHLNAIDTIAKNKAFLINVIHQKIIIQI